ncbi:MAG: M23 family metallopeptidase [Saprospiraceae bacterium]|nr:M23 family metallopeptidase [Saprospiraceae bacterium]
MRKEKFVYNKHTLRYEKVQLSDKDILLRVMGGLGIVGVYTMIVLALIPKKSDPNEGNTELALMNQKYQELNTQLDLISSSLDNIHERDAAIYREILEMDPKDDAVWRGGKGGSDKYAEFRNLSNSEILVETAKKISRLKHQVSVTASSQDEIVEQAKSKEKMLKHIPSIRPIRSPKKKLSALSGFGYRTHPVYKIRKMHTGIDFGARKGTPLYATGDGKIARVEYKKTGYGKNVVIDHGYGYKSLYAHMSKVEVRVGQKVKKGQQIGRVGSTGTSTSPHVHYEIIYRGKKINPMPYCLDGLTPDEYKAFVEAVKAENQAMSFGSTK